MGEREWNPEKARWERDGEPDRLCMVKWRSESGKEHSQEFSDVDQGYTVYQQMKKTAGAYNVRWIPADAPAH